MDTYPDADLDSLGLDQLFHYIVTLPDFVDDPALVNDGILNEILREWYEEVNA
jgi:FeS assembly protein IscX